MRIIVLSNVFGNNDIHMAKINNNGLNIGQPSHQPNDVSDNAYDNADPHSLPQYLAPSAAPNYIYY